MLKMTLPNVKMKFPKLSYNKTTKLETLQVMEFRKQLAITIENMGLFPIKNPGVSLTRVCHW